MLTPVSGPTRNRKQAYLGHGRGIILAPSVHTNDPAMRREVEFMNKTNLIYRN